MIDCNAFVGNWAFRRLRRNTAADVVAMLDQFGVKRACVASADAILYKDCQAGNEALYEETRDHAERFRLWATLNPAYAGWEGDLVRCVDWGFKGIRLYPLYQGYDLAGPEASALLDAAGKAGLPVSVPCRVVDVRQRHWMDVMENLDPAQILDVAEKHPGTTFLVTEGLVRWPDDSPNWERARALPFHVEMSRMTSVLDRDLQVLVEALGADRVLFGTGFPFKTPSPAFLKVQALNADDGAKAQIVEANAVRLFDTTTN